MKDKGNSGKPVEVKVRIDFKLIAVVLVWAASIAGAWTWGHTRALKTPATAGPNVFPLLHPRLTSPAFDTPEERRARSFVTLLPLKENLLENAGADSENLAFYIEDLNTGAWIGWKERDDFVPASLLKVPIAMGAMKNVDNGKWTLETSFVMDAKYKDKTFGSLWQVEDGTPLTLRRLIEESLQYSDNTATNILYDNLTAAERDDIYYHIGLMNPEAPMDTAANRPMFKKLSAKNLGSVFRALYNATFLTRKSSQYLLDTMTNTKFDKNLSRDIPEHVKVAHKMAAFFTRDESQPKNYHDCGIAYEPDHPYLYCVMTQNLDAQQAQQLITNVGGVTFRYFDQSGAIE